MMVMARSQTPKVAASEIAVRNIFYIIAAFAVVLFLYIIAHPIFIPAEAALNMQCGILIAKGKIPYIDFVELAAPALQYLYVVPALIARVLPLHPALISRLFVWFLYVASTSAVALLLLKARTREQAVLPWFVIAYAAVPFFLLEQFGQSEQIFVFLFMPYLLLRWLRWSVADNARETEDVAVAQVEEPAIAVLPLSKKQAIICGAIGGYAASLAPLFLLAFVAMELFFFVDKQRKAPLLAPEFLGALAVIALSLVVACAFGESYIMFVLPIVFYDYKYWDERLIYVYKTPDRRDLVYLAVALTTLSLAFRKRCSLITPMIAFSIVGLGLWIIPGQMLTNQSFPMIYGCVMAGVLTSGMLINQLAGFANRRFPIYENVPKLVKSCIVAGVFIGCYQIVESLDGKSFIDFSTINYFGYSPRTDLGDFSELIEVQTMPGDRILILSDRDRPASPVLLQLNREPGSFLLTGTPMRVLRRLFEREPLDVHTRWIPPKEKMYQRLANDIRKNRPKIILIENDALGDILKINRVMDTIDELYVSNGNAEWTTYQKLHPYKEYLGFLNPLQIYTLKGTVLPPLTSAPGMDPQLDISPKPPQGTPGLPAQTPAPGPLAPGTQEQRPPDGATPTAAPTSPPVNEQAPSPVANPIRI